MTGRRSKSWLKWPQSRTLGQLAVLIFVVSAALWPGPAAAWWNDQWSLRKKITIDTGASGAGISDAIGATPVLVRLHVGNFRFSAAKDDGSDLRFVAGDDKTPLKFHVEKYDSLLGEALVWVGVPDLKPGTKNDIWLYYGNTKAPAAADPKGTYDPDTLLVYHFADRGTPAQDVSAWANNAQNTVPGADGAIIGQGARFDGQTALTLPSSPSLAITEGGELTWSLWVKMTAPQPRAILFSRTDGAKGLVIGLDNGVPFVEVTNASDTQRSGDGTPIAQDSWHYVGVVAKGNQITLYVDGNPFSTLAASLPALTGAAQLGAGTAAAASAPASSGDSTTAPAAATTDTTQADTAAPATGGATGVGFAGDVDELQIAKVARPAGFIKMAAIGQGPDQAKLIAFSVDEENASWFSGYFAVILRSVTLDGWVVIGLLSIMAVLSWYVMYIKVRYLGRQAKANNLFLKEFRKQSDNLTEMNQGEADEDYDEDVVLVVPTEGQGLHKSVTSHSSLYRIYHIGATDIERRIARGKARFGFSEPAVASIRAALDTQFIRETQKLNRYMVMLTIAISGGPFLGLLGTVVGVMITFAAIAESGDVNVNAIAPGIAAALVATVAGLVVAIPSLFAYNYLIIRIGELTSDMQAFIDEFVTRLAEAYQPRFTGPHQEAAE